MAECNETLNRCLKCYGSSPNKCAKCEDNYIVDSAGDCILNNKPYSFFCKECEDQHCKMCHDRFFFSISMTDPTDCPCNNDYHGDIFCRILEPVFIPPNPYVDKLNSNNLTNIDYDKNILHVKFNGKIDIGYYVNPNDVIRIPVEKSIKEVYNDIDGYIELIILPRDTQLS